MPFVPYALALSLSVSYRKMRYSKIPLYRLRGKTRFREVVGLLRALSGTFTCARVNAGLGEAILQEMDRTAKGLASSGGAATAGPASAAHANANANASGTAPSPTDVRPSGRRALPAEVTLGSRRNVYVREADRHRQGSTAAAAAVTPRPIQPGQSPLQQLPTPALQQPQQQGPGTGSSSSPAPLGVPAAAATPGQAAGAVAQQQLPATALGDMLDVDIFGHFDPGFDLNTVDAALSANLDMGFPQMWSTPWPNWPS